MLPFEDQLDRDERLRAEALGLAIQFAAGYGPGAGDRHRSATEEASTTVASIAGEVHALADEFRKYIEDGLPVVEEDEEEAGE